jgi:hypothetical protein
MQDFQESEPIQPARMAPPSDTQPYLQPQRPGWPKAIGVIAIILGVLGLLQGLFGVIGQLFAEKIAAMMPEEQRAGMQVSAEWKLWMVLDAAARVALGILLIVGGAKLARRNRAGIRLCRTWAVLKILVVGYATVIGLLSMESQMAAMRDTPGFQQSGLSPQMMEAVIKIGVAAVALWGIALPIFLLIWFARRSVKEEALRWES